MKDAENQDIDDLTTEELLENIKEDQKRMKKTSAFALAALIAIIALCIAWFVNNRRVSAGTAAVSAKSLPYCIATKKTEKDDDLLNGLKDLLENNLSTTKGTELKLKDDSTYYVSDGENIRIQVSEDNNMNNNAGNVMEGVAPGTSGKITFYVIPREEGYKEFSFQMNLIAYKEAGEELQEINDDAIKSLLKGHILFFRNYSEDTGYTDWMNNSIFNITSEKEFEQNEPIPITIYWVWPEYFQSFMKSGELFKSDEVINEFISDMNSDISTSNLNKKYFYGFKETQFNNNNSSWTFDSLNANQYLYLTECYNAADFQIGSNVKYIYLDFELK